MPAISSLKEGSSHNKKVNPKLIESQTTSSTVGARTVYIYSLKSLAYNQKYPRGWLRFFVFEGPP
ncbi:MAG: hypothetical protein K0S84_754 [Nitrososphaera sp.]|jgi:hypothetical protein|nr:hypothetical protein [Nitrososphaera sp.]